jgi:hypothetical protein
MVNRGAWRVMGGITLGARCWERDAGSAGVLARIRGYLYVRRSAADAGEDARAPSIVTPAQFKE